ncbi:MAG TPA: hypothetical protein VEU73_13915 [Gemmatimonadales bacterium]|nr:hypothetical protein [Gemmatimonadales bacterium]
MVLAGQGRLSLTEYGKWRSLGEAAITLGTTREALATQLDTASRRISEALGVRGCIELGEGRFRVVDVAGIIRLSGRVELEVAPKFLSLTDPLWREDYFALAALSRYGRLLPREALQADSRSRSWLPDLLARAIVNLYDRAYRRPLREYRNRTWTAFSLDGEVEPESVAWPDAEGFLQAGLMLGRENTFNRVIQDAMTKVMPEVRDGDARAELLACLLRLGPQGGRLPKQLPRLPARHRHWLDLYDLAKDVLRGFGTKYRDDLLSIVRGSLPGFVIRTADSWETLVFLAARLGFPSRKVQKIPHLLGTRRSQLSGAVTPFSVTPDVTVVGTGEATLIIDAKYKTQSSPSAREAPGIAATDVYEALAFLEAAKQQFAVLVYPMSGSAEGEAHPGVTQHFEAVVTGGKTVHGITLDVRGISKSGSLASIGRGLERAVSELGGGG